MSDKELIALAAKAAGIEGNWRELPGRPEQFIKMDYKPWNPLGDDGDALRLAVKLCMICDFGTHGVLIEARNGPGPCTEVGDYRRAIVRAAAEIGTTMQ